VFALLHASVSGRMDWAGRARPALHVNSEKTCAQLASHPTARRSDSVSPYVVRTSVQRAWNAEPARHVHHDVFTRLLAHGRAHAQCRRSLRWDTVGPGSWTRQDAKLAVVQNGVTPIHVQPVLRPVGWGGPAALRGSAAALGRKPPKGLRDQGESAMVRGSPDALFARRTADLDISVGSRPRCQLRSPGGPCTTCPRRSAEGPAGEREGSSKPSMCARRRAAGERIDNHGEGRGGSVRARGWR